jgi:hypothetical protein
VKWFAWPTLIALSYSGSVAGVRLARPLFFDDPLLLLLLFALGSAVPILLVGKLRRPVGVLVALLIPVFWLYIVSRPDDPAWPWAIPLVFGGLIMAAGRAAQARPLPQVVPIVSLALSLALSVAPQPGRPAGGPRVVLVGVEGLSSRSADAWIAAGRMPHLARLQQAGRRAHLQSPPMLDRTQLWCAVASGVLPGESEGRSLARAGDCQCGRVWEAAQRGGLTIGVSGWPGPYPARADLGPGDFILPEPHMPDVWLEALHRGARLSTLGAMIAEKIARLRSHDAGPPGAGEASGAQRLLWALQGDTYAESIRGRRPDFASILFMPSAEGAAQDEPAWGALAAEFDRALGKLVRATPASSNFVIVAVPGRPRSGEGRADGLYVLCGPAATAAPPADSVSALTVAPAIAAWLGLPAPPWRPGGYTGIQ